MADPVIHHGGTEGSANTTDHTACRTIGRPGPGALRASVVTTS
jgi:hypothetical protein